MSDRDSPKNRRLLVPHADNFTPPSRTPWGGHRIASLKRAALGARAVGHPVVGESWELSLDPAFPSRDEGTGRPLAELLAGTAGDGLLVKLVDAMDALSVQIHPRDDYGGLGRGESGKPESWYVLHAEPRSGIFLGLREGVSEHAMRAALDAGDDVSRLLAFVEVAPGDFFLLRPGTAHAIGPGVLLAEPQRVAPGRTGVTYRYWDWNRRYAPDGRPDPGGVPRPLHVTDALAVTDWAGPREDALLAAVRVRAGSPDVDGEPSRVTLAGPGAPVPSTDLEVDRVAGTGRLDLGPSAVLQAITVIDGAVTAGGTRLGAGRTGVWLPGPADALILDRAHALLSSAP